MLHQGRVYSSAPFHFCHAPLCSLVAAAATPQGTLRAIERRRTGTGLARAVEVHRLK